MRKTSFAAIALFLSSLAGLAPLTAAADPPSTTGASATAVLVNDVFADGDRTTQALPDSMALYKAQSTTTASVAPGAATFTWSTTSADMLFGYFAPAGAPVSLGVGDALTVRLTFAFTGLNPTAATTTPNSQLRFGVFDSQGSRVTADSLGTGNTAYAGDTGYALFTPFSTSTPTAAAFDFRRRTTTASTNLFSASADFSALGSGITAQAFTDGTDYTLTYRIERISATDTVLSAAVTGGGLGDAYTYSVTETSLTPNTTFDYFGWRVGSLNFAAAITFKAVAVDLSLVPPAIATQPISQSVTQGATVTFVSAAVGSAPLVLQWTRDGVAIAGANAPMLTLVNVQPSDAGSYMLTATNPAGSATSDAATLTVASVVALAPVIMSQPISQSVLVGGTASFSVVADGAPPLAYQWLKNGTPLAGAASDTLAFTSVQLSDAGVYSVAVSDAGGTAYSAPAALNVTASGPLGIVNDSLADGERSTFAPPSSVAWFKAQSTTTVAVTPGAASFTWGTTSADMLFAYFTPAGAPVTLGVGDKLTLRLTFAFTGLNPTAATTSPSGALRFGILDSKGTRVTADNAGTSNSVYAGDTGYALFTTFSKTAAGTAFNLLRRTTTTTTNVFNSSGDFTSIASGGAAQAFADATDYTLTYTIERLTDTQTRLSAAMTGDSLPSGYSFSATETSATPNTTFDYFGWRVGSLNFAAGMTFKNLTVAVALVPPTITTQPVSQSALEGDTVVLTADATGSGPLAFQWSKDGAPVAGATGRTLTLANVHLADSGAFAVTVSNAAGTVTSNVATLVVSLAPPFITQQPESQMILVGETCVFAVAASGSQPFEYQWMKNGLAIPGATAGTLVLNNLALTDSGDYAATVTNGAGSATSATATLVVTTTPVSPGVRVPPLSQSVILGQPATFTVSAFGSTPLSYQWNKDGVAIPGARAAAYAIAHTAAADAGAYTVTITNNAGILTSDPAVLTVIVPAFIVTQPVAAVANAGAAASFTVVASGSAPLSYQWRKNGVAFAGATSPTLTFNAVQASDAGAYSVAIGNAGGTVTSASVTLTVVDPSLTVAGLFPESGEPAVSIDSPLKLTFAIPPSLGSAGTIRIFDASTGLAVDTIDLAASAQTRTIGGSLYNYYPVILTGSTALITPHVSLAYNKTYFVRIDRGAFKTANGVFDGINDATVWRFTTKAAGPASGTTNLVVAADGTGDFCTVQGAIDFVPTGNSVRRLILIKKGTYQELVLITNRPLITLRGEDRKQTIIAYANNATFNSSLRGVVATTSSDTTLENLTVRNLTPKGGSQAEAIRMNASHTIVRDCDLSSFQDTVWLNNTAYIENSYIEGDTDFLWGNAAAYFFNTELRALNAGYLVQARNTNTGHGFVFINCRLTGASGLTGYWLARIDPNVYPYSEVVYVDSAMGPHIAPAGWLFNNATASSTVHFCEYHSTDLIGDPLDVSHRDASSCQLSDAEAAQYREPSFVLGGWTPETIPFIEASPVSQTVSAGQDVVFSVTASGRPQPSFQWSKDGAAIASGTAASLLLPAVQSTDAGLYSVTVANSAGVVTRAATLTVVADSGAPAIAISPSSQSVAVGATVAFSVTATGTPALTYQWTKDGVPLASATSSALVLAGVQIAQAGTYQVIVSNAIGSVASVPAMLTISATPIPVPPTILVQPVAQTAIVGDTVTFSVSAHSIPSPAYQWLKDGSAIAGATAAILTLNNVQTTDAGLYAVTVSNRLGTVTSDAVALTVLRPGRLISLIAEGHDGLFEEQMTSTFVIQGTTPKTVLIRVAGPALRAEGARNFLRDPKLTLYRDGVVIGQNDNWETVTGDIAGATAAVGATPFAPRSRDAALVVTLEPGTYTVDVGRGFGLCRVEVYEVPSDTDKSRIIAGDTRGQVIQRIVQFDDTFTIGGDTPCLILVRALEPVIERHHPWWDPRHQRVDPRLEILSGTTVIARNDDWDEGNNVATLQALFGRVGASPLTLGSHDAALAVTLPPGTYRAHVSAHRPSFMGLVKLELFEASGLLIGTQPRSQTVNVGTTATFSVAATGAAPIRYQWRKNGVDIPGANAATLTFASVQPRDAGVYSVAVSNPTDDVVSVSALLTLTSPTTQLPPLPTFNAEGFATLAGGVTGGGLVDVSDTAHYKIIDASTASPAQVLKAYLESSDPLVIELRVDIDLGALNNQGHAPLISPELIASGLGVIHVASNKTLFSANGVTLRHGGLIIDGQSNIILRNLKFRGLWEWDDATQGAYDLQGWDFISITTGSHHIWVDHCDIGKAYDGQLDIVRGSDQVTVSWCRFSGDLGSEVTDQINYLESLYQANPADQRINYYKTLRDGGQTVADIIRHEIPQDKGSLVGNDDSLGAIDTGKLNVTFHHDAHILVRQRTPRMRFGNAHVYNMFVDDTASAAYSGTQTAVNSTANAAVLVENSDFLEVKTPFAYSTGGRLAQRGSHWDYGGVPVDIDPSRLNPADPAALVWNQPLAFPWPDLTTVPYAYTLDAVDYTQSHLRQVGALTPADPVDEALLRSYLPMTVH